MKKIFVFLSVLLVFTMLVVPASAVKYTDNWPNYVKISGGAYFEVFDTNLGQVTCVFPVEFKDGCFGFTLSDAGLPVNFVNVSNTTAYGYLYTSGGKKYSCRASRQDVIEYYLDDNTYSSKYVDLSPTIAGMTNTNINFLTSDEDYYNESFFDKDKLIVSLLVASVVIKLFVLLAQLFGKGKR